MMKHAIALDIGGSNIKYALVDGNGVILYGQTTPSLTKKGGLVDELKRAVRELTDFAAARRLDVAGIGMGVPSVVDNGVILFANNLPELDNTQPARIMECFNLPVYMDNDANMAGLAEAQYGGAKGLSDVVFLTVGTGIGGALILNGQLYGGYRNRGAEMGHIIVNGNGDGNACTCGAKGCLEAQASVTALIRDYNNARLSSADGNAPADADGKYIVAGYKEGQPAAVKAMNRHFHWLAAGIAGYINIFAPQKVIVGGGISEAGEFYAENLRERVGKMVMKETSLFSRIETAQLGNKAGCLGAAALVFRSLNINP
jgi:glucokinase